MPRLLPRPARAAAAVLLVGAAVLGGCATTAPSTPPPAGAPAEREGRPGVDYGTLLPTPAPVPNAAAVEAAVRALLAAQVAEWNAGDINGYMGYYWRSDSLAFISNGTLRPGWQPALYAYRRAYPDRAAMGTLAFEDLHITVLAPDAAFVHGRYRLRRGSDEPIGLFSLVLREVPGRGWRIVHDHTSSSP